jgi:hypothetical protein
MQDAELEMLNVSWDQVVATTSHSSHRPIRGCAALKPIIPVAGQNPSSRSVKSRQHCPSAVQEPPVPKGGKDIERHRSVAEFSLALAF